MGGSHPRRSSGRSRPGTRQCARCLPSAPWRETTAKARVRSGERNTGRAERASVAAERRALVGARRGHFMPRLWPAAACRQGLSSPSPWMTKLTVARGQRFLTVTVCVIVPTVCSTLTHFGFLPGHLRGGRCERDQVNAASAIAAVIQVRARRSGPGVVDGHSEASLGVGSMAARQCATARSLPKTASGERRFHRRPCACQAGNERIRAKARNPVRWS